MSTICFCSVNVHLHCLQVLLHDVKYSWWILYSAVGNTLSRVCHHHRHRRLGAAVGLDLVRAGQTLGHSRRPMHF